MNKNLKIAIGVVVGVGVLYLGYYFLFKKSESENQGGDTTQEPIVYDKATRRVVLVENN
jgi:hypothetical protein